MYFDNEFSIPVHTPTRRLQRGGPLRGPLEADTMIIGSFKDKFEHLLSETLHGFKEQALKDYVNAEGTLKGARW